MCTHRVYCINFVPPLPDQYIRSGVYCAKYFNFPCEVCMSPKYSNRQICDGSYIVQKQLSKKYFRRIKVPNQGKNAMLQNLEEQKTI